MNHLIGNVSVQVDNLQLFGCSVIDWLKQLVCLLVIFPFVFQTKSQLVYSTVYIRYFVPQGKLLNVIKSHLASLQCNFHALILCKKMSTISDMNGNSILDQDLIRSVIWIFFDRFIPKYHVMPNIWKCQVYM